MPASDRGFRRRRSGAAGRVALALALATAPACGGSGGGDAAPIQVSGSIPAPSGTAVDSDVNDLLADYAPNDSFAQAQEIPTPITLGGYVNVAGSGSEPPGQPVGRSTPVGDPFDLFRASLVSGQVIRLFIAENVIAGVTDLDLRLRDGASNALIAESATLAQIEQITVPSTGDFVIEVSAAAGSSNYVLTIGQVPSAALASLLPPPPPRAEFVPGEIVVRYRDDLLGPAAARSPAQRAADIGMRHLAGRRGGPLLLSCRDERERRRSFQALGIGHLWQGDDPDFARLDADERLRDDTLRLVKALRSQPDVQSAAPNYIRHPTAVPLDEFYPLQWHYESIHLPQAWDAAAADSGVIVAVLDTGILPHPDLAGQTQGGYDFISNLAMANDGDGCDADATDPGDGSGPGGSSWHGTHVAGTVAARTSLQPAGNTDGVAGVAWNARVMPLRVLGVGGGTDFDIMAAIRYAAEQSNNCGVTPAKGADIINMSFGGPGFSQPFQDLVTQLRQSPGLVFVAAAGNQSSDAPYYPADYDGVIAVSAVGPLNNLAPYSNFGPSIDVAAPGGDASRDVNGDGFADGVLSTYYDDSTGEFVYAFAQGTSMAAPHVSGVLALMLEANPNLAPADIDRLLGDGSLTQDIGAPNFFGAGLIDAVKAVNAAADEAGGGPVVVNPVLRIDPESLNFGLLADEFLISAKNGGGGSDPNVIGVSFAPVSGGNWLSVAPETVDPVTGLGTYRVSVDRAGLANGLYVGTLAFDSDANDVNVAVYMQVGDVGAAQPNAGHHFVLLVQEMEDGSLETIEEQSVDPVDGVYTFSFSDVEPGVYLLFAGSDLDGDYTICDAGEACGAYPTLDTILPLDVQSSRTGLTFDTGFGTNIGATTAGAGAPAGVLRRPKGGVPRAVAPR